MSFIKSLKRLREEKNISLKEISNVLNVSVNLYLEYEEFGTDKKVNHIIIDKLTRLYKVPARHIVYFLSGEEITNSREKQYRQVNDVTLKELRIGALGDLDKKTVARKLGIKETTLNNYEYGLTKTNNRLIYEMHKLYNVTCGTVLNASLITYKPRLPKKAKQL